MKASLKRCALVLVLYLALFELMEQLAVARPESWEELALVGLQGLLAGGLIWTVMPAFSGHRPKVPYRIGLFLGYAAMALLISNVYAWHIRPNVRLYQEPLWVEQHPGFQRELQARIERNRW
jgi:hypothetical protein